MKELILMCGIPGSGKSTFLAKNAKENSIILSRDKIRFSLLKDGEDYFSKEKEVWKTFIAEIQKAIDGDKYKTIYIDATHLNEKSRNKVLNALKIKRDEIEINCYAFSLPLETCLARNRQRTGRAFVPESEICKMFQNYKLPSLDEKYKYDKICMINADSIIYERLF